MKKNANGALGNKYENAPKTLKIAPEAPKEAMDNEDLIKVGTKIETNDDITAELRYIIVKLVTPTKAHNEVPNECKTNMLTNKCPKF